MSKIRVCDACRQNKSRMQLRYSLKIWNWLPGLVSPVLKKKELCEGCYQKLEDCLATSIIERGGL